jgi:hypothetical protein
LAAALAALAVTGCTLTVTQPDAGADAGPAADAGAQTVGDQCTQIYTELCMQGGRCAIAVSLSDCVSNYQAACCAGSVCNETSQSPASAVDACKTAIDAEGCYDVSLGNLPTACQGLPQKP